MIKSKCLTGSKVFYTISQHLDEMGGGPVKRHSIVVPVILVLCLTLAGCGGMQKPSHSTTVNAPTFPQASPAPEPSPIDLGKDLPPPSAENSTFEMVNGLPLYRIGPGDMLNLVITRGPTQDKIQVPVGSNGKVFVLLTEVDVNGLNTEQASATIAKELAVFFRNPFVEVQVKEFNSKKAYVFGSLGTTTRASGTPIPLTGRTTLLEAIGKAGGFNPSANMTRVRVTRANGKTYVVNMFRYMQEGDPALEFVLDSDDKVNVPEQIKGEEQRLFLLGEVKQPGPAPYFPNITIGQLIAQAGGWTDSALYDQAAIIRATPEVTEIYTVDLRQLLLEGNKRIDQYLKPNDIIFVPRTPIASWNVLINQLLPTFTFLNTPFSTALQIKAIKDIGQ
ncbi:MAG: SLBB domain-containing protein [candidate division NC10 bacterium]|nr:SLBB domain-containing protein [candidate division NC10 bacterium]